MEKIGDQITVQVRQGKADPVGMRARYVGKRTLREDIPTDAQVQDALRRPMKFAAPKALWVIVGILLILLSAALIPSIFQNDWPLNVPRFVEDTLGFGSSGFKGDMGATLVMLILLVPLGVGVVLIVLSLRKKKLDGFSSSLWPDAYFHKDKFKAKAMYLNPGYASLDAMQHHLSFTLSTQLLNDPADCKKRLQKALPFKQAHIPDADIEGLLQTLRTAMDGLFPKTQTPGDAYYGTQLEDQTVGERLANGALPVEGTLRILRKVRDRYDIARMGMLFYAVENKGRMVPVHAVQRLAIVEGETETP